MASAGQRAAYGRTQAKKNAKNEIGFVAIEAQQIRQEEDQADANIFKLENQGVIRFQGESDQDRADREAHVLLNRPGNGTTWI